jgi:AcrR family transcriptional regulator
MTHTDPTNPPQNPRPARRRRDPQGTRDRLVRAALDLFTTVGYHVSTTPMIAKKAGVAEGTIYRHFSTKSHLLNEIYRGAVAVFAETVEGTENETTSCRLRMQSIAKKWAEVAARDPELVRLVFINPPIQELDQRSQAVRNDLRSSIESVLASGKSAGEVRPGPVDVWADVWISLITLVLERLADGTWTPEQSAPTQVIQCAWDAVGNILAN